MSKAPYRVGAILSSNEQEVRFLGYGTYVGDVVPPEDSEPGSFLDMLAVNQIPNPKIELDNGTVVWGCQCWWGPEEKVKEHFTAIEGRPITIVDINDNPVPVSAEEEI